jgi:hypothetical protein
MDALVKMVVGHLELGYTIQVLLVNAYVLYKISNWYMWEKNKKV